jgi:hypothetical protein
VPPRQREVLEAGPAHGGTQPPAHTTGCHCGVLRLEAQPVVGVEGTDVVGALHVSGWMYVCLLVSFRLLVCVCVCVHTRESARARDDRERKRERERYVPEPDVGLDVRDRKPRSGLAYPAEKEEVLPVRVLDPDVLESECRP